MGLKVFDHLDDKLYTQHQTKPGSECRRHNRPTLAPAYETPTVSTLKTDAKASEPSTEVVESPIALEDENFLHLFKIHSLLLHSSSTGGLHNASPPTPDFTHWKPGFSTNGY
ncbi:hypothetical protein PoB_006686500 [Plakobranchus ocellatus]|uniref:Uncharacterized protein n=1 Tax=Plakobranchus ocellatus TaxID=259542 RepID=A0AAV4D8B4_9GAST|nr:hypothetical protein PoB_006686500 [Plakobranchus ocellatus]